MIRKSVARRALAGLAVACTALPAAAAQLEVTFTNLNPTSGFSFTPVWGAFHDGSFDTFDVGGTASSAVEDLAELGLTGGLDTDLAAADPNGQAILLPGTQSGPPTVDPGETASIIIDVDPDDARYFSFLTMLVPTNDTFLGNSDPMAIELFDNGGTFLGEQILSFSAANLYDAGTEVNDPTDGPAFVLGVDGTAGTEEGGVIHGVEDLTNLAGLNTPAGILSGTAIDFGPDLSAFNVAQITITEVAPVPLPATATLSLAALAGLGVMARRRRT